jgi:hypothetical protein
MTAVYVLLLILGAWSVVSGILLVIESHMIGRQREHVETRAWQEKVDAMRRLRDQEGDA